MERQRKRRTRRLLIPYICCNYTNNNFMQKMYGSLLVFLTCIFHHSKVGQSCSISKPFLVSYFFRSIPTYNEFLWKIVPLIKQGCNNCIAGLIHFSVVFCVHLYTLCIPHTLSEVKSDFLFVLCTRYSCQTPQNFTLKF